MRLRLRRYPNSRYSWNIFSILRLNSEDFSRSRNRGNLIFGSITLIELVKIDPIFFEYSWIFSNKIVFQMKDWLCRKSVTRCHDMRYMIRFLSAYCIFWVIWIRRLGQFEKNGFTPKTDQKIPKQKYVFENPEKKIFNLENDPFKHFANGWEAWD